MLCSECLQLLKKSLQYTLLGQKFYDATSTPLGRLSTWLWNLAAPFQPLMLGDTEWLAVHDQVQPKGAEWGWGQGLACCLFMDLALCTIFSKLLLLRRKHTVIYHCMLLYLLTQGCLHSFGLCFVFLENSTTTFWSSRSRLEINHIFTRSQTKTTYLRQ